MNKEAVDLLIHKHPHLKAMRAKLEAMQPGAYCIHRSWGIGRIKDYDAKEGRLIIDFEDERQGHAMDPAFCVDKLDILEPHNILVRHRTDNAAIEEMIRKNPCDLIVEILRHCPDQAAAVPELERLLARLLGDGRYRKWWSATKRLLVKDPRVAVPSKKSDPYILRDEPLRAEEEILGEFYETKAPKKKIALAEKLLTLSVKHGEKHDYSPDEPLKSEASKPMAKEDLPEHIAEIIDELPEILRVLTSSIRETKGLNTGERLHAIWVRNDLARFVHANVEELQPTSTSILEESKDLSELAEQIPSNYQKRYLNLIRRTWPEDWEARVFDLLRNSSGKFTSECIHFLTEAKRAKQLESTLNRWLEEHSLKGPLLLWILKNRNARKFTRMLSSLITPRLLTAIFYAIDYEALQNASTRRIPLADAVSDDPDLIPELLAAATPETARDLATTLMLNQGFDDLSQKSLLARFIKQFPNIQSLIGESTMQRVKGLIVSAASYDRQKAEYDALVNLKIPENRNAIAAAREHGDLRENAEYKMARQEQDTLLARKSQLERDLGRAQVTDFSEAPTDVVGIGSVVDLRTEQTGDLVTYAILGAWDSDPERHILSYLTPLATGVIGKRVGDRVSVTIDDHAQSWTLEAIRRWVDEPGRA